MSDSFGKQGRIRLEEEQLEALEVREDTEKRQEEAITCSQKYLHNSFMRFPPSSSLNVAFRTEFSSRDQSIRVPGNVC